MRALSLGPSSTRSPLSDVAVALEVLRSHHPVEPGGLHGRGVDGPAVSAGVERRIGQGSRVWRRDGQRERRLALRNQHLARGLSMIW
jgi:hypothetical protein